MAGTPGRSYPALEECATPPTIRDVLIPRLEQRFAGRALRTGTPPDPITVFPAVHPAVGDCSIWDEGDEATIGVGAITH